MKEYNLREIAEIINEMPPETIFKLTDIFDSGDPSANPLIGKHFKQDVGTVLTSVVSIGPDSANAQKYVKKH